MSTILFGGSFDPVHLGHIQAAEFALNTVGAKRVLFIPSARPFNKAEYMACAQDRLAMLEKALMRYPWAHICLYEIQNSLQGHPSAVHYTIDTLHFLQKHNLVEQYPYLLIGDDLLPSFHTWKDYCALAQETKILIATRKEQLAQVPDFSYTLLSNAPYTHASSLIRQFIAAGKAYRKAVPKEVYQYIERQKLYRTS